MAIPIPGPLVEFILLGPLDDRRQLQDSPILGDVWVEFGKKPANRLDLLIAPYRGEHAGSVAAEIDDGLGYSDEEDLANIAFLHGLVVARLTFEEVMRVVAPKTKWWIKRWRKNDEPPIKQEEKAATEVHEMKDYTPSKVKELLRKILDSATDWHLKNASNRRLQE